MNQRYDTSLLSFETLLDTENLYKVWIQEHWTDAFYYVVTYLIVIFSLKKFMQNRPAYKLKVPLVMWNIFLAAFSILGTIRTLPELIHYLSAYGLHHSICNLSFMKLQEVSRVWIFLFTMSKVVELLDTVFIILRKRPLIFLHWYHHITTLTYCWYSLKDDISATYWFMAMNYFVHSIMYSYYAVRCMNYKPPKQISILITLLQILQMIFGTSINIYAYLQLQQGVHCGNFTVNIVLSLLLYTSFFGLFTNFFIKAYFGSSKSKKQSINVRTDAKLNGKKLE